MIEPKEGQRGVMGQQHGLQQLTDTLAALRSGQQVQQQRDAELQAQLAQLAQGRRWQRYGLGVVAGLLLAVVSLVGWQVWHPPEMSYVRALGALDATLAQQWSTLPKPVQEQLSTTYQRLSLTPPGQRK